MRADTEWESTVCVLCSRCDLRTVLSIPHPEAPRGGFLLGECVGCGLRRIDPRPGPLAMQLYYAAATDYNAHSGRRRAGWKQRVWDLLRDGCARPPDEPVWSRLLRPATGPLARWAFDVNLDLERRRGLRVLDVGSGFGDLLIYYRARGCEVLGVDPSPAAAVAAREHGIEVRTGALEELALPAGAFDCVILCHSLEHVPDPAAVLREVARVLRQGGTVHVAVPNGRATRLETEGLAWLHLSPPFHLWFFDDSTLTALLDRAGLRVLRGPWSTSRWHPLSAWLAARRRGERGSNRRLLAWALRWRRGGGDVLRVVAERPAS